MKKKIYRHHSEIIAYVGQMIKEDSGRKPGVYTLTNWKGKQIGQCAMMSSWSVNSYVGLRMFQVYARVRGKYYTGRSFGTMMSVVLKPCGKSNEVVRRIQWRDE